jgi:hypothetical protein
VRVGMRVRVAMAVTVWLCMMMIVRTCNATDLLAMMSSCPVAHHRLHRAHSPIHPPVAYPNRYTQSLEEWNERNKFEAETYDLTSALTPIQSRLEALRQKGMAFE